MSHIDPQSIGAWVAIGATVVGAIVAVGKWIVTTVKAQDKKNDEQLREQRRMKRDLFGEDPDGGPPQTPLRQMVAEAVTNTRGLPERMTAFEDRLGKVEREREQDRQLLIDHITNHKVG